MSFHVEFHAASKGKAKEYINREGSLPEAVRSFLHTAVDNLRPADEDSPRVIRVKAVGHLCDGPGSYSASTAAIEVVNIPLAHW